MRGRFRGLALAAIGAAMLPLSVQAASAAPSASTRIVKVTIVGGVHSQPGKIRFSPARIARGKVRFEITNVDERTHLFEINGAHSTPRWLNPVRGKANATTTFARPGRYSATCPDADGLGISGVLVVV